MKGLEFTEFDLRTLELSWTWLNDPEIKRLTMTPNFTREEQLAWFNSLASKTNYFIWAVRYEHQPVGAVGIKNIRMGRGEYWGYIGERRLWGRGIGEAMVSFALEQARALKLKAVYLKVGAENERAAKLYQKMGFKILQRDDHICLMESEI